MSLLQTIELKRYFGETRAVDNVSLSIEEGEFVSLVGPNGAGKTSLCNVVSAYLRPDSGKIIFKGEDVTNASVTDRVKAGDQVVTHRDCTVLLIDAKLSELVLAGATVDCRDAEDGRPQLVLRSSGLIGRAAVRGRPPSATSGAGPADSDR